MNRCLDEQKTIKRKYTKYRRKKNRVEICSIIVYNIHLEIMSHTKKIYQKMKRSIKKKIKMKRKKSIKNQSNAMEKMKRSIKIK